MTLVVTFKRHEIDKGSVHFEPLNETHKLILGKAPTDHQPMQISSKWQHTALQHCSTAALQIAYSQHCTRAANRPFLFSPPKNQRKRHFWRTFLLNKNAKWVQTLPREFWISRFKSLPGPVFYLFVVHANVALRKITFRLIDARMILQRETTLRGKCDSSAYYFF